MGEEAPRRAPEPQGSGALLRSLRLLGPHRPVVAEHVRQRLGILDVADEGVHVVGVLAADEADSCTFAGEEVFRGDADVRAQLSQAVLHDSLHLGIVPAADHDLVGSGGGGGGSSRGCTGGRVHT